MSTDQASIEPTPQAPATSMPGVETRRDDTGENIVSSPAAFSFQPGFEKLFNSIFKLTDMEAMLICADEELRVETLLGDRTRA